MHGHKNLVYKRIVVLFCAFYGFVRKLCRKV